MSNARLFLRLALSNVAWQAHAPETTWNSELRTTASGSDDKLAAAPQRGERAEGPGSSCEIESRHEGGTPTSSNDAPTGSGCGGACHAS